MDKIKIALIFPDVGIDFGRTKVIYYICQYLSLQRKDYQVFLITNEGNSLTDFNELNISIKFLPISVEKRNFFNFLVSIIKLSKFVNKNNIHIIHSHHRYSDLISYLVSLVTNIKTISTVHSFVSGFNKVSFLNHKIVAVSHDVESRLKKEFRVNVKKLSVIYNGIEKPEEIKYVERADHINFRIICVGRFDYEKGQDILIKALEILWNQKYDIDLILVGAFLDYSVKYTHDENIKVKHDYKIEFDKLITINSEKIKITRSKTTPWDEISKSDLVVIPSRLEPFGLVAIESGVMEKCVIASRTGGLSEIIDDGENGILFNTEDVNELSEKILFLFKNREYLKTFGKALNKKVKENFSTDKMMEKYINLYKEL